jgi:hypothetical protein
VLSGRIGRPGEDGEMTTHKAYTTLVYRSDAKGYVPKCDCGWVGHLVEMVGRASSIDARLLAEYQADTHVGRMAKQEAEGV